MDVGFIGLGQMGSATARRIGERASQANVVKIAMNFMLAAACESMGEAAALASGNDIKPGNLV